MALNPMTLSTLRIPFFCLFLLPGLAAVDMGRAEAVLPPKEQVPRESYRPGDRLRAYVLEVNRVSILCTNSS